MKLIGVMPVRSEAWCLGLSARVALLWCDELVVLNHASIDGTNAILSGLSDEFDARIQIMDNDDPNWKEMEHRQAMLEWARIDGATHLAIIDADEVLTGNLLPAPNCRPIGIGGETGIRHLINGGVRAGQILQLPLYNLRGSLNQYHSSGVWGCNRFLSVAFADDPRLSWTGDRFHLREPQGAPLSWYQPIKHGHGGVMHLWGVSERRMRARHAMYKVTERLRWPDKPVRDIEIEYNLWRSPEDAGAKWPAQTDWQKPWTFADVPVPWWEPYTHLMKYLDVDAEPWQTKEVQRLVAEHGAKTFKGLDLFGVA